MRIISGKYKGRIIKMPRGIRPTQDKVRKALFDILGDIQGLSFLELFAGSGAVGLEALSQGAKEVVFVEKERKCLEKIKENLSVIGLLRPSINSGRNPELVEGLRYRVMALEVPKAIKQLRQDNEKFEIIFLDPPYNQGLAKKTLQTLSAYDILAPNGFIVVEHFKKDNLPAQLGDLKLFRQARYGDSLLSFYKKI